jgi:hypothetical protein
LLALWQDVVSDKGLQSAVSRPFSWRETGRVLQSCVHSTTAGTWQPTHRGFVCLHNETGQPDGQALPCSCACHASIVFMSRPSSGLPAEVGDMVCLSIGAKLQEMLLPSILRPMPDMDAFLETAISSERGSDPGRLRANSLTVWEWFRLAEHAAQGPLSKECCRNCQAELPKTNYTPHCKAFLDMRNLCTCRSLKVRPPCGGVAVG